MLLLRVIGGSDKNSKYCSYVMMVLLVNQPIYGRLREHRPLHHYLTRHTERNVGQQYQITHHRVSSNTVRPRVVFRHVSRRAACLPREDTTLARASRTKHRRLYASESEPRWLSPEFFSQLQCILTLLQQQLQQQRRQQQQRQQKQEKSTTTVNVNNRQRQQQQRRRQHQQRLQQQATSTTTAATSTTTGNVKNR